MKNAVFIFIISLFISQIMKAQTDVNVSSYLFYDTEPNMAVNPLDPGNMVTAWMSTTLQNIQMKISYTVDGGKTWSKALTVAHAQKGHTSADASLNFSKNGKVYFTYIDYKPNQDSGTIYMISSADGGKTWSTPLKVIDGTVSPDKPIDRPWVAIDNSAGKYSGRVYVCMKSVESGQKPHHVWMRYTDNDGKTWSGIKLMDSIIPSGLINNNLIIPVVSSDGTFYAAYYSLYTKLSPYSRIICLKSNDGGNSFTTSSVVNQTAANFNADTLYQQGYTLSSNPKNAANLAVSWVDNRNGDPDIYSAYSLDSGKTWSAAVRVNDDASGSGKGQDMLWGAFSSSGIYGLAWRDRRNSGIKGSSAGFDMYCAVSMDEGKSFSANMKLNSDSSNAIKISKGNDFIGVSLSKDSIHAVWSGLQSKAEEIYFNKLPLSVFTGTILNEIYDSYKCKISPNPYTENFSIHCTEFGVNPVNVNIYDMQGKEVFNKIYAPVSNAGNTLNISLPDLKKGQYIIKLIAGQYKYREKLTKE